MDSSCSFPAHPAKQPLAAGVPSISTPATGYPSRRARCDLAVGGAIEPMLASCSLPRLLIWCPTLSPSQESGFMALALGWDGLGWTGLGWAGLGWAGLDLTHPAPTPRPQDLKTRFAELGSAQVRGALHRHVLHHPHGMLHHLIPLSIKRGPVLVRDSLFPTPRSWRVTRPSLTSHLLQSSLQPLAALTSDLFPLSPFLFPLSSFPLPLTSDL